MKPDPNFKVHDENVEFVLKEIGDLLRGAMPAGYGFVFVMSEYGKGGNNFYTSSVERSGAIDMLEEMVDVLKGAKS